MRPFFMAHDSHSDISLHAAINEEGQALQFSIPWIISTADILETVHLSQVNLRQFVLLLLNIHVHHNTTRKAKLLASAPKGKITTHCPCNIDYGYTSLLKKTEWEMLPFLQAHHLGLWPMHYCTPSNDYNNYVTWFTIQEYSPFKRAVLWLRHILSPNVVNL